MPKVRLDTLLVDRGLFESRNQAAAAVMAGEVSVGQGGRRVTKPGQSIAEDAVVHVEGRTRYVSRGGQKLASAAGELGVSPAGRRCLDAGVSTGGFTDWLLQEGARSVIAVDVAYGELHWKIRQDDRVHVMERTNVRELIPGRLPYEPDLIVADLSFISLCKVLPALLACASTRFDMLAMVKPQFEVGRKRVGKGGVVREPAARRDAVTAVADRAIQLGMSVQGAASSGLPGPAGNRETFLWLAEGARGGDFDLRSALLKIEPCQ